MASQLVIPSERQEPWGWPAAANLFLGGAATGYYLLSLIAAALTDGAAALFQPVSSGLLAALLASLGFLALTVEAGRPARGYRAFQGLRRSWMSRETLSLAVFVSAVVLERVYPHLVLRVLAVSSAVLLMVSQGFILYRARAVAAWNVPVMPLLFLSSGLASGSGVLLMAADGGEGSLVAPASLGLLCAAFNAAVWLVYLNGLKGLNGLNGSRLADFRLSTQAMRRPLALAVTVGVGSVVPMLLLLMLFDVPGLGGGKPSGETIAALSGLALLAGTAAQKAGVVMKAGYLREVVLKR